MTELSLYAHHISSILKVLVYIEDHLDEELSLEKMSKIAHISSYYFHRLFHAYMKETLGDYVKRLRLQRARGKLQYSEAPITDIALDLGYETPSSFTKIFQQVLGQSPREYRKAMQPIVKAIMERTLPGEKMLTPEFVIREDETVLFVRKSGDYNQTPAIAFDRLVEFLQKENVTFDLIKTYYSIALDDPEIVDRQKCRFDACVALKKPLSPEGEVGQKTLRGGRYAVFTYEGPYSKLETVFEEVFCYWYTTSDEVLAERPAFCEHPNAWDDSIPEEKRISKLFIPLTSK